jgi:quercetin dioxygenase-like cupin family protein
VGVVIIKLKIMKTLTTFSVSPPNDVEEQSTISKNFFKSDGFRAMMFSFAAGEELTDHSSKKQAVLHVLSGSGVFETDTEKIDLQTHVWIHIPAECTHRVKAESDLHFLLYLVG